MNESALSASPVTTFPAMQCVPKLDPLCSTKRKGWSANTDPFHHSRPLPAGDDLVPLGSGVSN